MVLSILIPSSVHSNLLVSFKLALLFIVSSFVVRRYYDICLICAHIPSPIKFTIFIKKSVDKNESISKKDDSFKEEFF